MATRSTIWIYNGDNTFDGIYAHWDGYLSGNGKILHENYTTEEKVRDLISHGDVSILAKNIEPDPEQPHDFSNKQNDVCVFYGRDRGDSGTQPAKNIHSDVINTQFQEYNYAFFPDSKEWWIMDRDGVPFQSLSEVFGELDRTHLELSEEMEKTLQDTDKGKNIKKYESKEKAFADLDI